MIRFLIVGFGNPLRSDDGLGWHVARELEPELSGNKAKVQVIAVQQVTPDLAEVASRADWSCSSMRLTTGSREI